ncbi:MAG TPA: response regulator [Verrucomicrobiae bacterium]|nr:response regulator [Verrucomicrobiae bacterium]
MSPLHFSLTDDDPTSLFLVERLLKRKFPGAEVSCFECPIKTLEHVHRGGTNALITDHGMGPMTGTELIQQLRAENVAIPMVMISNNPEAAAEAMAAGADDFVDKADINRLPEVLKRMLAV